MNYKPYIPEPQKHVFLVGDMAKSELYDEAERFIGQTRYDMHVISPAKHNREQGYDPQSMLSEALTDARRNGFIRRDLRLISGADAVCILPGCERDQYASLFSLIACGLGLERWYYNREPNASLKQADQGETIDDSERGPDCAEERELADRNEAARLAKGGRHA